ncbi:DUF1643 domain-containing protein [Achromobacter piechaudii]|uniref:DUF1643 domain-containing protein n=1 Tax=Achromobacter piechaudii TaxID=72556 RepID=UPI0009E5F47F|nr:DUF1643 domain-containing protein [Achromobacter piechaudii]
MRYLHIKNVSVSAEFSTEADILYRYRLEINRDGALESSKTVCVVMQNPSYAGEEEADKSVQFLEKNIFELDLTEFKSVGRLIVVNQFARVQTNGFAGLPSDIGSRNDQAIAAAVMESEIVVIAWGSSNRFHARKEYVLDLLKRQQGKLFYQTRMHPSRGRYAGFIMPLEI